MPPLKISVLHPLPAVGGYEHTVDLLCLNFCRLTPPTTHVAAQLQEINVPLVLSEWVRLLSHHPDKAFARYICKGLHEGFRIGFQRGSVLQSARANMRSAQEHPGVIERYLHEELSRNRLLGPFLPSDGLPPLHINRFGVIPKGHITGKWRLITDLSFPPRASVNEGIDPELCSLSYVSVDEIANIVMHLGTGALMAKVDVESAYRLIPVHPHDRPLQAVEWKVRTYVDPMLPFGLRSAPKIFSAVADALEWMLRQAGVCHSRHYLDDFIILGPPGSAACQEALDTLTTLCRQLGVPLAPHRPPTIRSAQPHA